MWISWENPDNVSDLGFVEQKSSTAYVAKKSRKNDFYTRELINENKRLWHELKEKNDLMISLRDDIYYKQRRLNDLEKYKEQIDGLKDTDQYLELAREINALKDDQREKQTLIKFLNEMIERLCDEVLQNEHVEYLENEVSRLEIGNEKLSKENSEIKVRLKIVEYENDKLHARCARVEDENHATKKKLERTSKKLKDKENSILSFKKFTELADHLQNRISRSKCENRTLRNVIDKMKHVADNYEQLEHENARLKRTLSDIETSNEQLSQKVQSLQEEQLKINEEETTTKPALERERALLQKRLLACEDRIEALLQENAKYKTNLQIYEKILVENKEFIKEQEKRKEISHSIALENERLRAVTDDLNRTLTRELADKGRILEETTFLKSENERLSEELNATEASKGALLDDIKAIKGDYANVESEINDLRKQLQIYKNTVHNQGTTLKIRVAEMDGLLRENKELKLKIKQYESQIQMEGKVYKIVR